MFDFILKVSKVNLNFSALKVDNVDLKMFENEIKQYQKSEELLLDFKEEILYSKLILCKDFLDLGYKYLAGNDDEITMEALTSSIESFFKYNSKYQIAYAIRNLLYIVSELKAKGLSLEDLEQVNRTELFSSIIKEKLVVDFLTYTKWFEVAPVTSFTCGKRTSEEVSDKYKPINDLVKLVRKFNTNYTGDDGTPYLIKKMILDKVLNSDTLLDDIKAEKIKNLACHYGTYRGIPQEHLVVYMDEPASDVYMAII